MSLRSISNEFLFLSNLDSNHETSTKSKKKLKFLSNAHQPNNYDYSNISSRQGKHLSLKSVVNQKSQKINQLTFDYFETKYGIDSFQQDKLFDEILRISKMKQHQVQSLKVYRDQLKLICSNVYDSHISQKQRISVGNLKKKVQLEEIFIQKTHKNINLHNKLESQSTLLSSYLQYLAQKFGQEFDNIIDANIIDISQEEAIIIRNLELETAHITKQLEDEHKKNDKNVRQIQQDILALRVEIKQKQDRLRDIKSKICSLYIKLNNRYNTRIGSKSRDRNLSFSVKKFNSQNHLNMKEAFIGNPSFKNYSREVIEKVSSKNQLIKIRFYYSDAGTQTHKKNRYKQKITFQCIYKSHEGIVHAQNAREHCISIDNCIDATRDRTQDSNVFEEVEVSCLLSIKFFYKQKIVGIEYRIKTQKGNKHIKIGSCSPNTEHELLTLINKQVITMGSFWHNGTMIGISIWMKEKQKLEKNKKTEKSLEKNIVPTSSHKRSKNKLNHKNILKNQDQVFQEYYV